MLTAPGVGPAGPGMTNDLPVWVAGLLMPNITSAGRSSNDQWSVSLAALVVGSLVSGQWRQAGVGY